MNNSTRILIASAEKSIGLKRKISPGLLITVSILFSIFDAALSPSAMSKVSIRVGSLRVSDLLILIALTYTFVNWKEEKKSIHRDAKLVFTIILAVSCVSILLGFLYKDTLYDTYSNTRGLISLAIGATYRFELRNLKLLANFTIFSGLILIILQMPIGVDFATLITVIAGINFTFARSASNFARLVSSIIALEAIWISLMVNQRAQVFFLLSSLLLVILRNPISTNLLDANSKKVTSIKTLLIGIFLATTCALLLLFPQIRLQIQTMLANQLINSNYEVGNQLSIESRKSQLSIGMEALKSSWIYGHGPGFSYLFQEPGQKLQQTYITHNIVMDTALRIGAPLALFLFTSVWFIFLRTILKKSQDYTLKRGAYIFFVALSAKGFFESILDKPRIYMIFGACLGLSLNNIYDSRRHTDKRSEAL